MHSYVDAFINKGLIVVGGFDLAVVNRIFSSATVTKIGFQIDFKNDIRSLVYSYPLSVGKLLIRYCSI